MNLAPDQIVVLKKMLRSGFSVVECGRAVGLTGPSIQVRKSVMAALAEAQKKPKTKKRKRTGFNFEKNGSAGDQGEADQMFDVDGVDGSPALDDLNIPVEQRKTCLELTDKTCRWPVGSPGVEDFFFCGALTKEGSVYCDHHHGRAYSQTERQRPKRAA